MASALTPAALGARLRPVLADYPALPFALAAVAVFVVLARSSGGFYATTWYPAALFIVVLALVCLLVARPPALPRPTAVAIGALIAFALWSYISILWADQQADAWDAANRVAFYAACFGLFAAWRPRARPAALILGVYGVAIAVLGLVELLRAGSHPQSVFITGQFAAPVGYQNADVALWLSAAFPCVALAAQREVSVAVRAGLSAAAVVLVSVAVLAQSRGSLYALPITLVIFLVLSRSRVRTALWLLLIAAPVAAISGTLLAVYSDFGARGFHHQVAVAQRSVIIAAVGCAAIAAAAAVIDRRRRPSRELKRIVATSLATLVGLGVLAGLVAVSDREGNPVRAVTHVWHQFKTAPSPHGKGSRFAQSLGSQRYDYWRVALDRFLDAPLNGIGADNFQVAYLATRRSTQEPLYSHSVELGTLSGTGLVGAALLVAALVGAFLSARRALLGRSAFGAAAAAGALAGCAYWLVHGSVDWLWEFPALGGAAFAMLGLAAGLRPRAPTMPTTPDPRTRVLIPAAAVLCAVVAAASFIGPWVSALDTNRALTGWYRSPRVAYDRLATARAANPLSATPDLVAGSIGLWLGQRHAAVRYFRAALRREPKSEYGRLELGATLADLGQRAQARIVLGQAIALDPRDDVTSSAYERLAAGRRVNVEAINRELADRTRALTH